MAQNDQKMSDRECETTEAVEGREEPVRDGSPGDHDAVRGDDPEASNGRPGGKICKDGQLLERDLKENQKVLYDLLSLMQEDQMGTTRLTIEGRRFAVLELNNNSVLDVLFHGTDEGGYRGYSVLMTQSEEELFLWHTVEIAPVNVDGTLTFPDKVRVPSISLASLVKFAECSDTSSTECSETSFACSYLLTGQRVPRRLYEEAVEVLVKRRCPNCLPYNTVWSPDVTVGLPPHTVKIYNYYFTEDEKYGFESYRDTDLFVDWKDQSFRSAVAKRVEKREGKRKAAQEDESSGDKKKKRGEEVTMA